MHAVKTRSSYNNYNGRGTIKKRNKSCGFNAGKDVILQVLLFDGDGRRGKATVFLQKGLPLFEITDILPRSIPSTWSLTSALVIPTSIRPNVIKFPIFIRCRWIGVDNRQPPRRSLGGRSGHRRWPAQRQRTRICRTQLVSSATRRTSLLSPECSGRDCARHTTWSASATQRGRRFGHQRGREWRSVAREFGWCAICWCFGS